MLRMTAFGQDIDISLVRKLSFRGDPGVLYNIQYKTSINSTDWQPFSSFIGSANGPAIYFDESTNSSSRFYRAVRVNENVVLTLVGYPADGTVLKQGTDDIVAAYKIETSDEEMFVNQFPMVFDKRLWLYVDSITVICDGVVVASRGNLTVNDFDEVKAGSMYVTSVPSQNYHLPAHSTKHFSILLHSRTVSDRVTSNISILKAEAQMVDDYGIPRSAVSMDTRTFVAEEEPKGMIVITLDPSSPLERTIQISQSDYTEVPLVKLDAKSVGVSGTLQKLRVMIATSGLNPMILCGDVKLSLNGRTYSADSLVLSEGREGTAEATFGNLDEVLQADQTVVMTISAKVNPDGKGAFSGVKLYAGVYEYSQSGSMDNNPLVVDAQFNPISTDKDFIEGSMVTLSSTDVTLSDLAAEENPPLITPRGNVAYGVDFTFRVNAGKDTLYISNPPSIGFANSVDTAMTDKVLVPLGDPSVFPGDTATYFVIPAGSSRVFNLSGFWENYGSIGQKQLSIWDISFGTTSSNTSSININYGLEALSLTQYFDVAPQQQ